MSGPRSFTGWLYRPYVDLGPAPAGAPYHVHGLEFAYRNLVEDAALPRIQTSHGPSFRDELAQALGLPVGEFARRSAFEVRPEHRSEEWASLCNLVEEFEGLSRSRQVHLAWLLTKLGLYEDVRRLLPAEAMGTDRLSRSPEDAGLALVRSFLDLHSDRYDPTVFEGIAANAPPSVAKVEALYQLVLFHSKYLGDLAGTTAWMAPFLAAIEEIRPSLNEYAHMQIMSLYHRVGGFVPMMQRDKAGVVHEMALSEEYAAAIPRNTPEHRIGADEMTYYMLESRIKEALWLDDAALAAERAGRLTALSPNDPRGRLTFGQVLVEKGDYKGALRQYTTAARLAPPGAEVALFMVGQCHEAFSDPEAACSAYLACLDADPLAISAAESLVGVAVSIGAGSIATWATERCAALAQIAKEQTPPAQPQFYRQAPPPGE